METNNNEPVSSKQEVLGEIILSVVITVACCLLLGYAAFRKEMFNFHSSASQVLVNAVAGSAFFWVRKKINIKISFAVTFVLLLIQWAFIIKSTRLIVLNQQVLFFLALIASIMLYDTYFSRMHKYAKPFILMFLLAFFSVIETLIQFLVMIMSNMANFTFDMIGRVSFSMTITGGVSGLGLGMGILAAYLLVPKLKLPVDAQEDTPEDAPGDAPDDKR
ncbi:MAG: hypothetical protein PHN88_08175 [Ignavibacteria bacterium]|nr:hypothetical protein [Ignavibacteria bacterium]